MVYRHLLSKMGEAFLRNHIRSVDEYEAKGRDWTWVLGSEQVWRCIAARRHRNVPFFFLAELPEDVRCRSFSYAASFATAEWEGTAAETVQCTQLLREFKSVSVREYSGVRICRDVFGVNARQMPDAALLLKAADYDQIIEPDTVLPKGDYLAAYLLDGERQALALCSQIVENTGEELVHLMPSSSHFTHPLSVSRWLAYIKNCKALITDSFHGCVFAILYNKPFVCMGSHFRGMERFKTLLEIFQLEHCLLLEPSAEQVEKLLKTPIDWEKVNTIADSERERGLDYIKNSVGAVL